MGVYAAAGMSLAATIIAARELQPDQFGAYVLALAAVTVLGVLLDLTLTSGIVHHGFRLITDGDRAGLKSLLRAAVVLDIAIGLTVTGVAVLAAGPIAAVAGGGDVTSAMIQIAALTIAASTLDGTTAATLTLADRPQLASYCQAGTAALRVVGVLAVVPLGSAEALLASYAVATALGSAIQAIVAWRAGRHLWQGAALTSRPPFGFATAARRLAPFAVHGSMTTTLLAAVDSLVLVFLGQLSGTTAVAMFKAASLPVTLAALATGPVRMVMLPKQARLYAEGRLSDLEHDMRNWTKLSAAVAAPAVVLGFFLVPWLIPALYGSDYTAAVDASRVILLFAFLHLAFPWTKNFAAVVGQPKIQSALALVMIGVAVPTIAVLSDHGASAAAAGLSAGALAMTAGYVAVASRYFARARAGGDIRFRCAGGPRAPGRVRDRVHRDLAARVTAEALPKVVLLTSEIVTNSVRHGGVDEAASIDLRVTTVGRTVRVEVRDSGLQGRPVGRTPDLRNGTGFGLFLVSEVASRWSADHDPRLCVWFEIDEAVRQDADAHLSLARSHATRKLALENAA